MDDRGFDRLARAVARGTTRRGALHLGVGALVAALVAGVRPSRVAADGIVPLGGPCVRDRMCSTADGYGYVACAPNGFDHDGIYNCCRFEGGYCGDSDQKCCDDLVCSDRFCASPFATRYRSAGEPCDFDGQCLAADTSLYCADNGFDYDGPLNCCALEGGRCYQDEGCCGASVCIDGFCSAVPLYRTWGEACTSDAQCRAADAPLYCGDNGFDYDGPLNCCAPEGSRCPFDEGCCGFASCIGGFCAAGPVYLSAGDPCSYDDQCRAADAPLYCQENGFDYDGPLNCCAPEGGRCFADEGCCGWTSCINGFCGWG